MDPLVYGLTWFVWGGLAVTALLGWVKALEWATVQGVALWVRQMTTGLLFLALFLALLVLVVDLDREARDPIPTVQELVQP